MFLFVSAYSGGFVTRRLLAREDWRVRLLPPIHPTPHPRTPRAPSVLFSPFPMATHLTKHTGDQPCQCPSANKSAQHSAVYQDSLTISSLGSRRCSTKRSSPGSCARGLKRSPRRLDEPQNHYRKLAASGTIIPIIIRYRQ